MANKTPSVLKSWEVPSLYVLLVDDMPVIVRMVTPIVESLGKQLMYAQNPHQAFQMMHYYSKEIDLVLLDWHLPMMSGIEMLSRMKASSDLAHLTVIMLTSNTSKQAIAQAFSAGASHYLIKPYKPEELKSRIQDVYDKINFKKRIMVVDDSNLIITMVSRLLKKMGYEVTCIARDGDEAKRVYFEHKPYLIFMDLNMPKVDGMQAIANIRNDDPKARIICMTSNHSVEVEEDSKKLGAIGIIRKPFDENGLYHVLVDALK